MTFRGSDGGPKAKQHFFLDVDMKDVLEPISDEQMVTGSGTKLVVTIGPSVQDQAVLEDLLRNGMSCARIDLTWGTPRWHRRSLENLQAAMRNTRRLCSVWLDTTGREVMVRRDVVFGDSGWPEHGETFEIVAGAEVRLTGDPTARASNSVLPITYPAFAEFVEPGSIVLIGRYLSTGAEGGTLVLRVREICDADVICEALVGAHLDGLLIVMARHPSDTPHAQYDLGIPVLTQGDTQCIREFGADYEIDYISVSYCSSASDVREVRGVLDQLGMQQTKIIAKIERKPAIAQFENICRVADGITLSRGNLGLDYEPEAMARLQKRVVARCNYLGKPVIITRFVDTMVNTPRPTRAEATDVANAVLDGVDCILLGAETLRGIYPLETLKTVARLAKCAELHFDYRLHHEALVGEAFEEEVALGDESGTAHPGQDDFAFAGGSAHDLPARAAAAAAQGDSRPYLPAGVSALRQSAKQGSFARTFSTSKLYSVGAIPAPPRAGEAEATPAFGAEPVHLPAGGSSGSLGPARHGLHSSKLESIASTATRVAEKIAAGLIVVMAQTGRTASLVAKFRPPMPILTVVVPTLRSDGLKWQLDGRYLARQCLILRGVTPMLAAPMSEGSDDLLSEAIASAAEQGLTKPRDYVVCIMAQRGTLVVKVVQVNDAGTGMRKLGDGTLLSTQEGEIPDEADELDGVMPSQMSSVLAMLRRPSTLVAGGFLGGAGEGPNTVGTVAVPRVSRLSSVVEALASPRRSIDKASPFESP